MQHVFVKTTARVHIRHMKRHMIQAAMFHSRIERGRSPQCQPKVACLLWVS